MLQRASCSGGGPRIPPVPAARARQGAWRVEPRDHGMEHQADVHPQLRLILPDAGPGCEKNGRRATWPVTTRSGRNQVPVAVLPTAKSLSAFSLKPQSDRLLAYVVRDLEVGAALIDRALVLNSNLAVEWYWGGWVKNYLGAPEAALERFARAMRLSPLDPFMPGMRAGTAHAHFFLCRYDQAASSAAMALQDRRGF